MSIMGKQFNDDSSRQFVVNDNDLHSINIFLDKNEIKNYMSELLDYSNNSKCLLMDDKTYKAYKFPVQMYCIGFFSIIKDKEATMNYLVPNSRLLFLLNHFYKKMDKKESLNYNDLKKLYEIEVKSTATIAEKEVAVIEKLKNNIKFIIKRTYDYNKVKGITFDSFHILIQENLPLNAFYIPGIIDNANDNAEVLKSLDIDLSRGFQKNKSII